MSVDGDVGEVTLVGGGSASACLHDVLVDVAGAFPDVFAEVELPASAGAFREHYPAVLSRFEACRAGSERRAEIATALAARAERAIAWTGGGEEVPLSEHLAGDATALPLEVVELADGGSLHPRIIASGRELVGDELVAFARDLVERGSASAEVAEGVDWIVGLAGRDGIDLSDRRIAILGGAAELSPARSWLEGGADVTWIDTQPPPAELLVDTSLAGTLRWCEGGADLLREPARVVATLEDVAGDGPLDLGLYAYAPGKGREWRLTGAMNAVVDALADEAVRTITMLVSPTTPGVRTAAELAGEERRRAARPRWQRGLDRIGLLGKGPGHVEVAGTAANRGVVAIQGASYQAAQYLGKMMAAEAWSTGDAPRQVSASMAGISRTESLRHPVFETAFGGAAAFGVETFEPATTATLNGLLALRDWLDPQAPAVGAARVHGGLYESPYPIESALRIAAVVGVGKDPRRIGSLVPKPGFLKR